MLHLLNSQKWTLHQRRCGSDPSLDPFRLEILMFETLLSGEKNIQGRFQSFYSSRIKRERGGLVDVEQPPGLSHFKRQLLSKSLWIIFPSKEQRIILLMVSVQQQ